MKKKAAGEAYRQASSSPARHLSRRSVCAHTGDDFLIVPQTTKESCHETPNVLPPAMRWRSWPCWEMFDDDHRVRNGFAVAADCHRNLARVSARAPEWPHPVAAGVDRAANRDWRGPRAGAKRREAGGLPLGTVAPDFELPDLTGVRRKLSEFREQNVLLIFFNPQCGFCTKMAADLAALPTDGGDQRAVPVVVTTGDAEENRKLVERYGIRCLVLLQEQMEVAAKYGAQGTPMGYRIDGAGRIASELAVGAEPLLRLATTLAPDPIEPGAAANGSAPHGAKDDPSLARSRLNRSGLKAGVLAPDFRLPRH